MHGSGAAVAHGAAVSRYTGWHGAILVDAERHLTLVAGVPVAVHVVQRPDESLAVRWEGKDVSVVIFEAQVGDAPASWRL